MMEYKYFDPHYEAETIRKVKDLLFNPRYIWEPENMTPSKETEAVVNAWKTVDLETSLAITKAEAIMDCPFEDLVQLLTSSPVYDPCQFEYCLVEQLGKSSIFYTTSLVSMPFRSLDFCIWRREERLENGALIALRSVIHPRVPERQGFARIDVQPSCYHVQAHPTDPTKCKLTMILESDFSNLSTSTPIEMKNMDCSVNFHLASRAVFHINSFVKQQSASELRESLYIRTSASEILKGVNDGVSLSALALKGEPGFKTITNTSSFLVWSREENGRKVFCTKGVFEIEYPAKEVFDTLRTWEKMDPFIVEIRPIQLIKDFAEVRYVISRSIVLNSLSDCVLLHVVSVNPSGVYSILFASVEHGEAPPVPGISRFKFPPSAYFIHPAHKGHGSIISYYLQIDGSPYLNAGVAESEVEKIITMRSMVVRNSLRIWLKEHAASLPVKADVSTQPTSCFSVVQSIEKGLVPLSVHSQHPVVKVGGSDVSVAPVSGNNSRLNMISKLCGALVEQRDEKFKLSSKDLQVFDMSENSDIDDPAPKHQKKDNTPITAESLDVLPNEILFKIMNLLDYRDISRFSQVNKRFKFVSEDDALWKKMFSNIFQVMPPTCPRPDPNPPFSSNPGSSPVCTPSVSPSPLPMSGYDWRDSFKKTTILKMNWSKGRYRTTSLPEAHQKSIRCLNFSPESGFLFSGSADRTVKMWDINSAATLATGSSDGAKYSPRLLHTFSGTSSGVLGLSFDGSNLRCGYKNGQMKVWDVYTKECIWSQIFNFHTEGFYFLSGNRVISWDSEIDIWDLTTGRLEQSMNEHTRKVNSVQVYKGQFMVSGSSDKLVKRWDIEARKCTHTFSGHSAGVNCVDLDETMIVSGGNDRLIKLWDLRVPNAVATYKGHVSGVDQIQFNEAKVVSGSRDNTVRVWERSNLDTEGVCILKLEECNAPCSSLVFDEKRIIIGTSSGGIFEWNFDDVEAIN